MQIYINYITIFYVCQFDFLYKVYKCVNKLLIFFVFYVIILNYGV